MFSTSTAFNYKNVGYAQDLKDVYSNSCLAALFDIMQYWKQFKYLSTRNSVRDFKQLKK